MRVWSSLRWSIADEWVRVMALLPRLVDDVPMRVLAVEDHVKLTLNIADGLRESPLLRVSAVSPVAVV